MKYFYLTLSVLSVIAWIFYFDNAEARSNFAYLAIIGHILYRIKVLEEKAEKSL